jgi:hypothetical protein
MIGRKSKMFVVIGLTVLLLGAGVVLGKNTQQTTPLVKPLDRGQWSDNFDSYETGSALMGQGGWFPWDGIAVNTGYVVDDQARSTPNSAEIKWTDTVNWVDMVHTFTDVNSGNWTFTAWLYVPSTMTGNSFFILMNNYVNGSHVNQDWSLQLEFSASGGTIFDYNFPSTSLPIVKDDWSKLEVFINFDIDQQTIYYNGQFLEQDSWKNHVQSGGQQNLGCVDLYADSAYSTAVYWDDLKVAPPVPPLTCDADGPYTGETGTPVQFTGTADGGTPPYTWEWTFGDGGTAAVQNPTHVYTTPGLYDVTLTVTDAMQETASDATTANITKAPEPIIVILNITGGKGISAVIKNEGDASASMVPWSINLTGGILLKGRTKTGSILQLGIGETHTITSSVLGLGRVTITVSAGNAQKQATGFIFLFFALKVK